MLFVHATGDLDKITRSLSLLSRLIPRIVSTDSKNATMKVVANTFRLLVRHITNRSVITVKGSAVIAINRL